MIFVFKTSVKTKTQIKKLQPHIDKILPKAKWNFDLEDCDKILRIDIKENIVLNYNLVDLPTVKKILRLELRNSILVLALFTFISV